MSKFKIGTPVSAPITPGSDDMNVWPTHINKYGQGGLHFAENISARDNISMQRRVGMTVLVASNDDGEPEAFKWTGKLEDGTDGSWQHTELGTQKIPVGGVTFVNGDGSTTSGVEMLALSGLSLEGNDKDGFTLKVTGGSGGSISVGTYGQPSTFSQSNSLELEWPLKAWSDADKQGASRVSMEHGLWQLAEAPNYLAYLNNEEEIIAKNKVITGSTEEGQPQNSSKDNRAKLWFDYVVCPSGAYIEINRNKKTIGLQEADQKDPNISGGMDYYIAFVVSPIGEAPEQGFIRPYIFDETNKKFAEDMNGQPLAVQVNYEANNNLKPSGNPILISGLVNEKGLDELSFNVEDNFLNDSILLGDMLTGPTGVMIQAITNDSKSGTAFRQFELDTGIKIRDEIKWIAEVESSLSWEMNGYNIAPEWGAAKQETKLGGGFTFFPITVAKMSAKDGYLIIEDTTANEGDFEKYDAPTEICDFYIGKIHNSEHTHIYRGKEVKFGLTCKNKLEGVNVALVYWDGTPNKYPVVFDSRTNGSVNLSSGWRIVSVQFDAEQIDGDDHTVTGTAVLPSTSNNFGVIAYPSQAQSPMRVDVKDIFFGAKTPFNGVISNRPFYPSERAIEYNEEKGVFAQTNESFASLRYTITSRNGIDVGIPMPCGELVAGALDIEIDKSVNVVSGSGASGGEGAFKFKNDGTFYNHYTYVENGSRKVANSYFYVYPGEALKKKGDSADVTLWWAEVSADGQSYTKISDSVTTVTVEYGDAPKIVTMKQWSSSFEGGDRIALRAYCNIDDGAFLESTSKSRPLVNNAVYYKELVLANI